MFDTFRLNLETLVRSKSSTEWTPASRTGVCRQDISPPRESSSGNTQEEWEWGHGVITAYILFVVWFIYILFQNPPR